ncbi:hypothetical protein QYE76_035202 [Lolium multiflorum]|uniref:Uncharacterized protein n=1 Tax=Lolium multiflorum TaxID=4521 RepID=A0AAD8R149_LOLMU|nr:hypothetical protein QYE76_035202 [Lolium multiflorum]
MMQLLQTLMADRENNRAERQANIAALQQLANNQYGHGNHDHPGSKLKNFQNTNPPVFSKTEEPLDADDWLQTMENNLEVAGVDANEKVLFATHYLAGPARAWWTSTHAMNAGQIMTWADFKLKFNKYHVPPGLIKKMRDEFHELKQGRMSVVEYRDRFLTLSRYAPDETDTTEKRKERFLNGLHDEMQTVLVNIPFADLEALVDSAIQMEGKLHQANENRKRRMMHQSEPSNTPRYRPSSSGGFAPRTNKPQMQMSRPGFQNRSGGNPRPGGSHHNNHNNNSYVHHNNNFNRALPRAPANNNPNNSNTTPRTGSNAIPVSPKDKATITCYECGVVGHYSNECPKRLANIAANTAAPAQQQRRVTTGKKFTPNNPNNRNGRLFQMSAEEAQEAPDVVLDALSRKRVMNSMIAAEQPSLYEEFEQFRLELVSEGYLAIELQPTLISQIKESQKGNASIDGIKSQIAAGKAPGFTEDEEGVLWYNGRLCVPSDSELKQVILKEAHDTLYSIHPGGTKMYQDLKEQFWWHGMKREVGRYISKCDNCQRVKAEHQRPAGLLQPLQIPEWKWDSVGMDFIIGLPKSSEGNDSIWVVVDRWTKVAHFIPVKTTYQGPKLAELYISRIVALHGTPKSIVSDRGSQFTSRFWQKVHEGLGTRLNFSNAYHPQTDGQTERVNQILEDMLRACVLEYGSKWEDCLPYAEFSYNNLSSQLTMAPLKSRTEGNVVPLNWSEVGESQVSGPDVLREAEEKVHKIREYLKTAQSRQKSYANKRHQEMTFEIADFVYLKVSPLKGMQRFQLKGKLAPRYVGPFKVLSRRGEVSYQLELPEEMAAVHNVFHISLLRKCLEVPEKTKVFKNIDHRLVDINTDLTYREVPIRILEEAYRTTRTRSIKFLKIQWSNHTEEEATGSEKKI